MLPTPHPSRRRRTLAVGVIDLVSDTAPGGVGELAYTHLFRKQNVSVMPQIVSAWCRKRGHQVHYASYYGQTAPERLLPDALDLVFVCCTTQASGLAYALARLFRRRGTRTVLGGPHARSFPADAARFFDIVVGHCDEALVRDILDGHVDPGEHVSADGPPQELPGVAERMPEIARATFYGGRGTRLSAVPIAASQGCPYACDFCIDARSTYRARSRDALEEDLRYLARHHPGVLIAFTDPNFAVRFDETLDALEAAGGAPRIRYVMEASLSILKPQRLERLRRSGCIYVAPGVESWFDYGQKSGLRADGRARLEATMERFAHLERQIGGVQANFILGTDEDEGPEPFELTREFVRERPDTFPTISIPTPYGGTPLQERLLREGRVLEPLPFAFYGTPYLPMRLRSYGALEYYDLLIHVKRAVVSRPAVPRRASANTRMFNAVRRIGVRSELRTLLAIRNALASTPALLDFHEGRTRELPAFYQRLFEEKLGRYAELVPPDERLPWWEPAEAVPAPRAAAAGPS